MRSTEHTYSREIAAALARRGTLMPAALAEMERNAEVLGAAAALMIETLRGGGKVLLAGNGGSAAEAQHFAAELVGRFQRERPAYAALALTTDTSILTAVANDYSYEDIFARQVAGLGRRGDLLIAFSTSGESENLVRAAETARERQIAVVAVTGNRPSRLEGAADLTVRTPAEETPVVQELHTMITHLLCDIAETDLCRDEAG